MIISIDPGIKNLCICIYDQNYKKIEVWEILNIKENTAKINHYLLSKNLKQKLDKYQKKYFQKKENIVLIENQPSYMNPKMKSIQMIIFSYFTFQTSLCHIYFKNPLNIKQIDILINNHSKYKYILKEVEKISNKKEKCIILTNYYIQNQKNKDYIKFFHDVSKKDDYSDSFIQIIMYLYNHIDKLNKKC